MNSGTTSSQEENVNVTVTTSACPLVDLLRSVLTDLYYLSSVREFVLAERWQSTNTGSRNKGMTTAKRTYVSAN